MKKIQVTTIPKCDAPGGCGQLGRYDLPTMFGPWANLCEMHADEMAANLNWKNSELTRERVVEFVPLNENYTLEQRVAAEEMGMTPEELWG